MRSNPAISLCLTLAACGSSDEAGAPGTLRIGVYGEEFIEQGIPAAVFADGWTLSFEKFLIVVGEVSAARGAGAPDLVAADYRVYDLAAASDGAGQTVATVEVPGGAYDSIAYQVPRPKRRHRR